MKRRFKLLAVFVGVPVVLVVVAVIVLPILANSSHYKREVTALVKQHTGHDLHIDGDVQLRVLPSLRLKMTNVRLGNPPGFTDSDFATLASLTVDLKLLPLLAGRIETHTIGVRGLTVNLERDDQGRGNWEASTTAGQDAAAQESAAAGAPLAAMTAGVALGGLDIRDAALHWRDNFTGEMVTIAAITLQTGALNASTGVDDVRLHATLSGSALPGRPATIEARGDATLTTGARALVVPNLTATVNGISVAEMGIDATLRTRLTADFAEQRLTLDTLRVSVRASDDANGHASVEMTTGLAFDLTRQRLTESTLSVKVPTFSLSGVDGDLIFKGTLAGDLRAGTYTLEGVRGSGTMSGEALADSSVAYALGGALNADFETGVFSARGLEVGGSVAGSEHPDERLAFRFMADLDATQREGSLAVRNMHLSLADWRVDGAVMVHAAEAPRGVQGGLDLAVEGQQLKGSFAFADSATNSDSVDLHLDVVADLDIEDDGYSLRGSNAVALRATVTPVDAIWQVGDLQLDARLADASFPDGELAVTVRADLEVDVSGETVRSDNLHVNVDASRIVGSIDVRRFDKPAVRFDLQVDAIDADRYFPPLPATTDGSAQATPVGASIDAIRALDLAGELRVQELTLRGMQLQNVRLRAGGGVSDG